MPPQPPRSLPHDEYVEAVDGVIDNRLEAIRRHLKKGTPEPAIFASLFHGLLAADEAEPGTDRVHGIAAQALMRLAKALETR